MERLFSIQISGETYCSPTHTLIPTCPQGAVLRECFSNFLGWTHLMCCPLYGLGVVEQSAETFA